ncbi:hypothetical protein HDU92_006085 [Lobulomyces angularis]|nr:hypothetical protein HDU92_006085 [Lobulomyces angularis]
MSNSLSQERINLKSICVRNKITRATFYNWRNQGDDLKSVTPLNKTGRKLILDQDSKEELIEFFNNHPTMIELQETTDYVGVIRDIPNEKRVYTDESFVYDDEEPTYGRSTRGQRISRPRKLPGKRWTFNLAIRLNGVVYDPLISTENAKDETFLFMEEKRARTAIEVRSIVKKSCDKNTRTAIQGNFKERGDGREFRRLYPDLL